MSRAARRPPSPLAAADASAGLPDTLQFMRLLWAIVHALQKASKRMTGELGVTGPQRLVLRVVGMFPGLSAGALAAILHVHPSTLTGVLQRLTAQGLVARSSDGGDRRRAVLRLTPRGARINGVIAGTVEEAVRRTLRSIPDGDRAAMRRVLTTLTAHLEQPSGRRRPRRGARGAGR